MNRHVQRHAQPEPKPATVRAATPNTLRRKCACGSRAETGETCPSCRRDQERGVLRRKAVSSSASPEPLAPQIVHEVLSSPGVPLDRKTRDLFEPRFGRDFSQVRLHAGTRAAESTAAVGAAAYTVGNRIVIGAGHHSEASGSAGPLLAHELTHVAQGTNSDSNSHRGAIVIDGPRARDASVESEAESAERGVFPRELQPTVIESRGVDRIAPPDQAILRRKSLGTKVTQPKVRKSPYKMVKATFDGAEFVVLGDGKEILRVDGESGRSYAVRAKDASACKGATTESYLNNPKYVGIQDNGPIPEGEYRFRAAEMATFSAMEQAEMDLGGQFTDPFGKAIHGGDWGAGRVELKRVRVLPSKDCGDTASRSGFYLHGGIMPGSSGCIDIGNLGFKKLVDLLVGYVDQIAVTVRYAAPAPDVGAVGRALGRFTYPTKKDPSLWDRIESVFSRDSE